MVNKLKDICCRRQPVTLDAGWHREFSLASETVTLNAAFGPPMSSRLFQELPTAAANPKAPKQNETCATMLQHMWPHMGWKMLLICAGRCSSHGLENALHMGWNMFSYGSEDALCVGWKILSTRDGRYSPCRLEDAVHMS